MDPVPAAGLAAAAGFLLGSVPFSWIAVKARTGTDLRTVGSGNVGATNAARVLGRAWFPPLFLLDAGKGYGAVAASGAIPLGDGSWREVVLVAGAAGALLGHVFPPWLRFRGGKAVATGAGTLAALSPWAVAAGLGAFALAALLFRFVSLGSVVAALGACAAQAILSGTREVEGPGAVDAFVVLVAAVVVLRHLPNLRRIAEGTEPRIGAGARSPEEPDREE